jgi:hypothetical protein
MKADECSEFVVKVIKSIFRGKVGRGITELGHFLRPFI